MGKLFGLAIKLVESTTIGANPDDSIPACVKGAHIIMTKAVRIAGDGAVMVKGLAPAIENIHAPICRYPEHSLLTFINLVDRVSAQTVWIRAVMPVTGKGRCIPIESIQSAPPGANPELACPVYIKRGDAIVAQRLRIGRIMLITGKPGCFRIEFTESTVRANP